MLDQPPMLPVEGQYQVAAARHEIMFRDCSAVGLYQVWEHGAPVLMLRATTLSDMLVVFDLRDVAPELDKDLRELPQRDRIGAVFYTLRAKYDNARDFLAAASGRPKRVIPAPVAGQARLFNLTEQAAA